MSTLELLTRICRTIKMQFFVIWEDAETCAKITSMSEIPEIFISRVEYIPGV